VNPARSDHYSAEKVEELATKLLVAAGSPPDIAHLVSAHLVWSDQIGHTSHGVLRVLEYVARIRAGKLDPAARATVVSESPTTTLLDGNWGYGQVAAMAAVEAGIEKCRASGVSVTGAYHINHVGRLGDFTERCARAGLIAFLFVGGTPPGAKGNVAPFGGRGPVWGTNPLAIAIPTGDEGVFSLDFATSVIAAGKAIAARGKGEQLDSDYLIDSAGEPSRDPVDLLERGGAIRPFGDHKGYGLAFVVELLAGALVGALAPELGEREMHNGLLLILIDPQAMGTAAGFEASVAAVVERVKACPPAEGFGEVMVPGEPERLRLAETRKSGIPVAAAVVEDLTQLGVGLGVELDW
jgi:LDH2 family malate/lactate/ureidoglycolate dehydrogenase